MMNVTGSKEAHVGKMDAILSDSHLNTSVGVHEELMMNVVGPKLECAGKGVLLSNVLSNVSIVPVRCARLWCLSV